MVSRFAGQFNAVAFAYGCGAGTPAPLMVNTGNPAAGVTSVSLIESYTVTEDGILFYPLATTTPTNFGQGANLELLTPSSASNSAVTGVGTVTANFANLHGQGDLIASGTYGLQEALNYVANVVGGGTVVVGSKWTQLGGTTAMLAAATVGSTVSIEDQRGGVATQANTVTVALTNVNMLALNATPITVVPAQGAGTLIEIVSMVFDAKFKTAAFAGGSAIGLKYGAAGTACSATIATTVLTSFSADQSILVAGALAVTVNSSILNTAVVIQAASTEFTNAASGLSTAIIKVTYRVHRGL